MSYLFIFSDYRDKAVTVSRRNILARPSKNPTPTPHILTKGRARPRKNKKTSWRPHYYRRDGTPYEASNALFKWARDLDNMEIRRVAQDKLTNGIWISTVWLGLDHNLLGKGRPLIFETMVFVENNLSCLDCWRYSTEEEAIRGHKILVNKWKKRKKRKKRKTADEVLSEAQK